VLEPTSEWFEPVVAAIDAANAEDPNMLVVGAERVPKELLHSRRMVAWVELLDPNASEAQLVAARAHHLRRWETPRTSHPAGRAGYLRWRRHASRRHAEHVTALMRVHGAPDDVIAEVGRIVAKEGLGRDPAVQTHEDALCLTFLELQLEETSRRLDRPTTSRVLGRTLEKMSPRARALAASLRPELGDLAP
jgi:hypothetical protein